MTAKAALNCADLQANPPIGPLLDPRANPSVRATTQIGQEAAFFEVSGWRLCARISPLDARTLRTGASSMATRSSPNCGKRSIRRTPAEVSRLQFSFHARDDLREIFNYIAQDNPEAAARVRDRLEKKCRTLADYPYMGREREDITSDLYSFPVAEF